MPFLKKCRKPLKNIKNYRIKRIFSAFVCFTKFVEHCFWKGMKPFPALDMRHLNIPANA